MPKSAGARLGGRGARVVARRHRRRRRLIQASTHRAIVLFSYFILPPTSVWRSLTRMRRHRRRAPSRLRDQKLHNRRMRPQFYSQFCKVNTATRGAEQGLDR
uniref:Uncharacterized protein n=1 Tax=Plectus sambesii TaxID=2011161 RepID=A0A914W2L7_9BILA